jgi:hypothetical protein
MNEKADMKRGKSKRKIMIRGRESKFTDADPVHIARALRRKDVDARRAEMEKKFAKRK